MTARPRLAADYGSSCREMKPHNIDTDNVLTMIIIPECSRHLIGQTAVTQPSHWSVSVHSDQPQVTSLLTNRCRYIIMAGTGTRP